MLVNWFAGKHIKKINDLQKAIDQLREWLDFNTKNEKYCLEDVAIHSYYLEEAFRHTRDARALGFEDCCHNESYGLLSLLECKKSSAEMAEYYGNTRRSVLRKLVLLEYRKKKEIEALTTAQKIRRLFCFLC
ncbi:uncharacterized protein LOC17886748 [Capsella rubella]|uniref:uncharacterized protein LOC17886748 n=1 Tax=Capsella rubella TaxID=81985 RepID=UPI000CD55D3B|nr:uncharacterized protein LOC17886748 [Capsella rubella]